MTSWWRRLWRGRQQRQQAYNANGDFDAIELTEDAASGSPADSDRDVARLLAISRLEWRVDTRPPLDAALYQDHLHDDDPTPEQIEGYRQCFRLESTAPAGQCQAVAGMQLGDYSLRTPTLASLPPGVSSPVTSLMSTLTLTFVPPGRQVVLTSSGRPHKGGGRMQSTGWQGVKEQVRYTVTCILPEVRVQLVAIPERLQRHVAVGRMLEDNPHVLKVLSIFEDCLADDNAPRDLSPGLLGQQCLVTVTCAFTHTLAMEIDRRTRLRRAHLTAAGRDALNTAPEDLPCLFSQQALVVLLHQLCLGLLHLSRAPMPLDLMLLTPDVVFLQRRPETSPSSWSPWDTLLMVGAFAGTVPNEGLSLSPASLAQQSHGPRLNTEGRSGGLAYVVNQMLGGVDPIQYILDTPYSRRCCRVLTHLLEEEWDVHLALQQLTFLIFGDPQKGPVTQSELDAFHAGRTAAPSE